MMMKLYANAKSGNCYKVLWMLRLVGIPHEYIPTSFIDGGTKTKSFLEKNPNAQVPLLELDCGKCLAESNAMLLYLAEQQNQNQNENRRLLVPDESYSRALMYQWLFFEQYSHEPAIAVRRANLVFQKPCTEEKMQQLLDKGHKALRVMEKQLGKTKFLIGDEMTLADIALFAYTHVAHEGGYDIKQYPNIQQWLGSIRKSPNFFGDMDQILLNDEKKE